MTPDARPHGRQRLLLASNRGPVTFRVGDGGNLVARRGGGGLVTALGGLARHHDVTWVSHAMGDGDVAAAREAHGRSFGEVSREGAHYRLRIVGAPDAAYNLHYNVMANPLLWFIEHRLYGFGWEPVIDRHTHAAFRAYRQVNQRVADALLEEHAVAAEQDDRSPIVMVHDYQLFLVPGMLRAGGVQAFVEFFLHIPWPEPGAWRCLPRDWLAEFVESMLSCDLLGLQTRSDVNAFLRTVDDVVDAEIDGRAGTVRYRGRTTHVRVYPISVAATEFHKHVESGTVRRLRERVEEMRQGEGKKLIVRVDRTDPSKNLVRGFRAYQLLLHEHPELQGEVTMFCQLDPSRQDIPEYSRYLDEIHAAADEVNIAFGTGSWQPLFVNLDSNFLAAVAAYTEYDVLFVNPVADGMNLVTKEGPLVNERDGVVVLSEQAGAYNELGPYVIGVNPFDIAEQADALYTALTLPEDQRRARAAAIREQVTQNDVRRWIDRQLDDITALRAPGAPPQPVAGR